MKIPQGEIKSLVGCVAGRVDADSIGLHYKLGQLEGLLHQARAAGAQERVTAMESAALRVRGDIARLKAVREQFSWR